jgi:hypothetical protein
MKRFWKIGLGLEAIFIVLSIGTYVAFPFLLPAGMHAWGTSGHNSFNAISASGSSLYAGGTCSGEGGSAALIVKFDLEGNEIWSRVIDTLDPDAATSIACNESSVYTCILSGEEYALDHQLILVKHDADGNQAWSRTIEGIEDHAPTLWFNGTHVFTQHTGLDSDTDGLDCTNITCWRDDGTVAWTASITDHVNYFWAHAITTDDNALFVCGSTAEGSWAENDFFIAKLELDGTLLWNFTYGKSNGEEIAQAVVVNGTMIYVVGTQEPEYSYDEAEVLLLGYNQNGSRLLTKPLGGSTSMDMVAAAACDSECLHVAGNIGSDIAVISIDGSGTVIREHTWGTTMGGQLQLAITLAGGHVLAAGSISGSASPSSQGLIVDWDVMAASSTPWIDSRVFGIILTLSSVLFALILVVMALANANSGGIGDPLYSSSGRYAGTIRGPHGPRPSSNTGVGRPSKLSPTIRAGLFRNLGCIILCITILLLFVFMEENLFLSMMVVLAGLGAFILFGWLGKEHAKSISSGNSWNVTRTASKGVRSRKYCMNCKRELPTYTIVGDACPGCGGVFGMEEKQYINENGADVDVPETPPSSYLVCPGCGYDGKDFTATPVSRERGAQSRITCLKCGIVFYRSL